MLPAVFSGYHREGSVSVPHEEVSLVLLIRYLTCVIILCNSVTYLRLDGSVEPEKRYEIVKAFNSDPTIDVLLLTTHARFVVPVYTGIPSLSRYGTLSGTE
ncbi:hypothetical protein B296_00021133, partial [Ensete ventricosum]